MSTIDKIGPYEVSGEIGRGGMGVVYLAHDSKLERDVAIKSLPDDFADDEERLARFEREAKTLASLNHPNIASIYGLEEVDGNLHLVLEFVPGETLDDVLRNGPMPMSEALPIAKQIAEAIEFAHEHGIIHRDLKPANIKFSTPDQVKVLDFGLAKAFDDQVVTASQISASPTIIPTHSPTIAGVIMGTAGYLSPEQARGRAVDRRADIFSFGCVLFEMLTGEAVFPGETVTDSLGATLHKDPKWELLPSDTPPTIQLLLRRCLTKDRKRRLQDIGDARIEIDEAIADPTASSLNLASAALGITRQNSRKRTALFSLAALACAVAAGGGAWLLKPPPTPDKPVLRFTISTAADTRFQHARWYRAIAISPDGTRIVYSGKPAEGEDVFSRLYQRYFDQFEAEPMSNTEDSTSACFSPDGQWIAFIQNRMIKRVSTRGGPAQTICPVNGWAIQLDWGSDGTIVFSEWVEDRRSVIRRVSGGGGTPIDVVVPDPENDTNFHSPYFLPDASGIVFTASESRSDWDKVRIMGLRFDESGMPDGEPIELFQGGSDGRYVETGHLVFRQKDTLMAAAFDLDAFERTGDPFPVLEHVAGGNPTSLGQFDISDDGILAYATGESADFRNRMLVWMNTEGVIEQITPDRDAIFHHSLSNDGTHFAYLIGDFEEERTSIHVLELRRNISWPVISVEGDENVTDPVWHPSGEWMAFRYVTEDESNGIFRVNRAAGSEPVRLTQSEDHLRPDAFSPDGRTLAFTEKSQVWLLRLDENGMPEGEPEIFAPEFEHSEQPHFSRDGNWIVFCSRSDSADEEYEVFVKSALGTGAAQLISKDGGYHSRFSPTEDKLYFTKTRNITTMMSASYAVVDGVLVSEPAEELFTRSNEFFMGPGFNMTPDGERFTTVVSATEETDQMDPRIILNWFEELKAKDPSGQTQR